MSLRIDRLTTLYVVDPLRRSTSTRADEVSVSILMYHSIADQDETGVEPYYRTATTPAVFAAQMENLNRAGFSAIGLDEAIRRCTNRASDPKGSTNGDAKKYVVITFDDGFRNFYTDAFPILNRYRFTATMFLPTAYIGDRPLNFKGKDCLNWGEVRELHQHGISFGSHTVTHPQLHDCDAASVKKEIWESKQTIEQNLGSAIQSFAYPYAFPEADADFKRRLRDELSQAGYENGVCTTIGRPGKSSDPFFLKRLPVNSDDDARLFQAKLAGSYDWLAKPQYLKKVAKRWLSAGAR
jgi:peptidoglycan/xylan/chitin deacetylase (PgdA/CDA1 family)